MVNFYDNIHSFVPPSICFFTLIGEGNLSFIAYSSEDILCELFPTILGLDRKSKLSYKPARRYKIARCHRCGDRWPIYIPVNRTEKTRIEIIDRHMPYVSEYDRVKGF